MRENRRHSSRQDRVRGKRRLPTLAAAVALLALPALSHAASLNGRQTTSPRRGPNARKSWLDRWMGYCTRLTTLRSPPRPATLYCHRRCAISGDFSAIASAGASGVLDVMAAVPQARIIESGSGLADDVYVLDATGTATVGNQIELSVMADISGGSLSDARQLQAGFEDSDETSGADRSAGAPIADSEMELQ